MKNKSQFMSVLTVLLAAVLLFSCATTMQPLPEALSDSEKTGINSIVSEFPADSQQEEDALCAKLIDFGNPGVFFLCQKLIPMGQGNDTDVRFAVGSLARYVSRPGAENERTGFVKGVLAGIEFNEDVEVKSFLMSQLHDNGKEEVIAPLSAYLTDLNMCEPAAQALLAIHTGGVEKVFLQALKTVPPQNRVTVVRALGELQCKAAAASVARYANSADNNMKMAALWSLANIADYSSAGVLHNAIDKAEGYDKKQIEAFNLLYANRIMEDARGNSESVGAALLKDGAESSSEKLTIGALNTLVNAKGKDAVEYLIETVDSENPVVRNEILSLAQEMPGEDISQKWLNKMKSSDKAVRNEIMDMLVKRNDPAIEFDLDQAVRERELEEGFVPLFNGTDLSGWVGDTISYAAEAGKIVIRPEKKGPGNLYTEKEYDNFVLRFEFKLPRNANNGLGIRAPLSGDAAYVGMELQIIDNNGDRYTELNPYQYHGSVYGVAAARRGFQNPVEEWNVQEVVADGRNIKVVLNGTTILDVNLDEAADPAPKDGREHPGLARETGHIGFLGHGHRVEFRNIRIKEL